MNRLTTLPRLILERTQRVRAHHAASKLTPENVARMLAPADPLQQPSVYRTFDLPAIPLPTKLMDAAVDTVALLREGVDSHEEHHVPPPQDLRTLASWLFMADGLSQKPQSGNYTPAVRTCPSSGATYPYELYVAALAIDGLEPGLYHYHPREFCLRRIRDGDVTLSYLKKGRPELELLKDCPAAILVSTIFSRASWRFRQRGYRSALLDAGHMIQNVVTCGQGLGMQTLTRLRLNDTALRELIGLWPETEYAQAEAAQGLVIWADRAVVRRLRKETPAPSVGAVAAPNSLPSITAPLVNDLRQSVPAPWETSAAIPGLMGAPLLEAIARPPLAQEVVAYGSIVATHQDCVEPGGTPRDLRPPLTELSPLPPGFSTQQFPLRGPAPMSSLLRKVLVSRRSPANFVKEAIPVDVFTTLNALAFRGGTFMPLAPNGPHAALVRPFWIVHSVSGFTPGVWYYDLIHDTWGLLREGLFRNDTKNLCIAQEQCHNAAAVCFLAVNLLGLMDRAGPDMYRMGLLEAGAVAQRICLAAASLDLGANGVGSFYDDRVRAFLGLHETGWEIMYALTVGTPLPDDAAQSTNQSAGHRDSHSDWRD